MNPPTTVTGDQVRTSYSQVTQQTQVPTKEQAVILDAIEGIPVIEYTRAIAKKINPANIRYVSRVSNNRVCLFVNNKETANELIDVHKIVNINDNELTIRPLVSRAKRIILSNVWPFIPNNLILQELQKLHILPVSQISYIRAGNSDQALNHVLCFRRQMYLNPNDVDKIPPYLIIRFDDTDYHIYLSAEKLICFVCNEEGHLAKFCKQAEGSPNTLTQQVPAQSKEDSPKDITTPAQLKDNKITDTTQDMEKTEPTTSKDYMPPPKPPVLKRVAEKSLSTISSLSENTNTEKAENQGNTNIRKKKSRIETTTEPGLADRPTGEILSLADMTEQISPAKEFILRNEQNFPLNLVEMTQFLHDTYNKSNVIDIALQYTEELESLSSMLLKISDQPIESKLKNRISRLRRKLQNHLCGDSSDSSNHTEDKNTSTQHNEKHLLLTKNKNG